jgi:hypothetical protein
MDIPELGGSWQEEPLRQDAVFSLPPIPAGLPPATDGGSLVEQQKIVMDLVDAAVKAYKESPDSSSDLHLEKIYDSILTLAGTVGISAFSLPKLCASCGRKKRGEATLPRPGDEKPAGLGDVIKVVLSFFGIRKKCEGCERRRRSLNRIRFGP